LRRRQLPQGRSHPRHRGNLYGTAGGGGQNNAGVVFRLTHGSNGWGLAVMHNFCNQASCTDGSFPSTGLSYAGQNAGKRWDGTSPVFGHRQ
jgi:uncharacterized repeat protein (TIGR03803 family)